VGSHPFELLNSSCNCDGPLHIILRSPHVMSKGGPAVIAVPATTAFEPAAIAGSWPQLAALLTEKISSLTHAVIVLATSPNQLLTEPRRDRLWQAFRVPVYEQIVSEDGTLLAAECEAHNGVHIESDALSLDPRLVDSGPCGCGRSTPRLRTASERVHAVAAYAR
jgi:hypothetical protein